MMVKFLQWGTLLILFPDHCMYAVFSFKFFYNYGSFFFFRTKTICQGFLKEFMKIFKVILVTIFNLDF